MVSVDCVSFIFPPGLVMPFASESASRVSSLLLSKQMFSPAPVQSPLSLQFHILGLAFLLSPEQEHHSPRQTSVQILSESPGPGPSHWWRQYNCSENDGLLEEVWVKRGLWGKAVRQKMVLQWGFIYGLFPGFVLKLLGWAVCSTLLKLLVSCWVSLTVQWGFVLD